jgi:ABC-type uncharacterized transport system substrate-binding protein
MLRCAIAFALALSLAMPSIGAAQSAKPARIGFLSGNSRSDTQESIDAFRAKLQELGHTEGQNLLIEHRYADGDPGRLGELAADLVRLKVDAILTYGTPSARAAKAATRTIPIVFAVVSDPMAAGLVTSLTRNEGNTTGVTPNNPELSAKRVSLLKELAPAVARLGVLANPTFVATPGMVKETLIGTQALGLKLQVFEAGKPAEIVNGLIVLADPMFIGQRRAIVELAMASRIPAVYHLRNFVEAGGLISYGAEYGEMFRQSAVLMDKILKGAKPSDLPVEQPWRYDMTINLKSAKALGLVVPPSLRLRANEVIE